MTAYRYEAASGASQRSSRCRRCPPILEHSSTCAEVQISPAGRFLYGSNRGHDSIVIYAIDAAGGGLTLVGHESTRGGIPRNFSLDPTGKFVAAANQDTDDIVMFTVDPASGHLLPNRPEIAVGTPVCVRFY